jgi:O-antigen/teichoic acid export membrane protein
MGEAADLGTPGRRQSFRVAATLTYGSNILVGVLSLVNVLITSRVLGPSGRGQFVFLTTIAMLTAALSSMGVEEATANVAGREPSRRRTLGGNAILLALLFGGAAAVAVGTIITAFPAVGSDSDPALRVVALASIPLLVLQVYLQFLIRSDYGFAVTNIAILVAPALNVAVNGTLAAAGVISVGTAIVTWVSGQALATTILVWYVMTRLAGFGRPAPDLARQTVGFGVKAHAGRVMKTGNYRLDQWLLGAIAGSRELGLYSVAVAWSEALFYLPEALGLVMRPDVVRAAPREAGRQAAAVFRTAVLLTVPLVLALIVAAPFLCITLMGDEFGGSVSELRVLAPGAFGMVAMKLLANTLTAQRKPMLANAAIGVAFIGTIAFDLLLIPNYGGQGAAIASTISYTAGGLAVAAIFARSLHLRVAQLLPRRHDVARLFRLVQHSAN